MDSRPPPLPWVLVDLYRARCRIVPKSLCTMRTDGGSLGRFLRALAEVGALPDTRGMRPGWVRRYSASDRSVQSALQHSCFSPAGQMPTGIAER